MTTSINLDAYPQLSGEQQAVLYKHGRGATTKASLYEKVLDAINSGGTVRASTTERNSAKHTVKSPIESMLAAEKDRKVAGSEQTLGAVRDHARPSKVSNDNSKTHGTIGDLEMTVNSIIEDRVFPKMQGSGSDTQPQQGYLALAEKLQPPLWDESNQQLRVLVEHRTDELVAALNAKLAGKPDSEVPHWRKFLQAAKAMDAIAKSHT